MGRGTGSEENESKKQQEKGDPSKKLKRKPFLPLSGGSDHA